MSIQYSNQLFSSCVGVRGRWFESSKCQALFIQYNDIFSYHLKSYFLLDKSAVVVIACILLETQDLAVHSVYHTLFSIQKLLAPNPFLKKCIWQLIRLAEGQMNGIADLKNQGIELQISNICIYISQSLNRSVIILPSQSHYPSFQLVCLRELSLYSRHTAEAKDHVSRKCHKHR